MLTGSLYSYYVILTGSLVPTPIMLCSLVALFPLQLCYTHWFPCSHSYYVTLTGSLVPTPRLEHPVKRQKVDEEGGISPSSNLHSNKRNSSQPLSPQQQQPAPDPYEFSDELSSSPTLINRRPSFRPNRDEVKRDEDGSRKGSEGGVKVRWVELGMAFEYLWIRSAFSFLKTWIIFTKDWQYILAGEKNNTKCEKLPHFIFQCDNVSKEKFSPKFYLEKKNGKLYLFILYFLRGDLRSRVDGL